MVFVRLKPGEISSLNANIHQELHSLTNNSDMDESYLQTFLVRWGFCLIPPQKTLPFTIGIGRGHDGTRMYASLYALSKLWIMDYEVDYVNYGCLFVKSELESTSGTAVVCYLTYACPEPVWIRASNNVNTELPSDIIKAGSSKDYGTFYFGRSYAASPCIVTSKSNYVWYVNESYKDFGELLQDTGHQLLRALRGDPVPPNAVIVGVSEPEGSLYLGRIGGNMPCTISTEDGKIKYFNDLTKKEKRVESGEIMVLTNAATD